MTISNTIEEGLKKTTRLVNEGNIEQAFNTIGVVWSHNINDLKNFQTAVNSLLVQIESLRKQMSIAYRKGLNDKQKKFIISQIKGAIQCLAIVKSWQSKI
jgi:hypothetical protein